MNERILKLAASCFPRDGDGNIHATPEIIAEFAELIVRECMEIARKQRDPANLNYKPSERFVEDLRQHFGVEE